MKKMLRNREHLLKMIWILGGICWGLGLMLWALYQSCRHVRMIYSRIPSDEILQRVDVNLFKISFLTNNSEYVATNLAAIYLAVILGIAFLALLILLGIYMNPREKEPVGSSEEKTEDASAS